MSRGDHTRQWFEGLSTIVDSRVLDRRRIGKNRELAFVYKIECRRHSLVEITERPKGCELHWVHFGVVESRVSEMLKAFGRGDFNKSHPLKIAPVPDDDRFRVYREMPIGALDHLGLAYACRSDLYGLSHRTRYATHVIIIESKYDDPPLLRAFENFAEGDQRLRRYLDDCEARAERLLSESYDLTRPTQRDFD